MNQNLQLQEELAKVIKAEAKKSRPSQRVPKISTTAASASYNTTENRALKALVEAEDMVNNDELEGEDEDDDDYGDDDEDEDEDDEDGDDIDEEEIMTQCPDYCRCIGQYAAATTAK